MIGLQAAVESGCDFGDLVREHRSMVFSVAYHFLHDRDQAEEIAQDVFFSLHKNMGAVQSPAQTRCWSVASP